ncbi:hypothetical protein SLS53_008826 [Cytospora paraplurivora]|uniref:Protein kinase domain-containing protein n=1 Tax=Cytospora paraplurivora TaxID=2898453 RepID=A0AAN9TY53_9PEZI
MPDPETQSTILDPKSHSRARLPGISEQQAVNPPNHSGYAPPALVTQIDRLRSQSVPVSRVAVEEPEQLQDDLQGKPCPENHLQPWLENISAAIPPSHPPSVPTSGLVTQTAHTKSDEEDGLQESEHLHADLQEKLGLDLQAFQWDPRLRIVFHNADGNTGMKLVSAGAQQFLAEPKAIIRTPNDPLLVELMGCQQSRSDTKCVFTLGSLQCQFHFIAHSDDVLLRNRSDQSITLLSRTPGVCSKQVTGPGMTLIQPAQWRITCGEYAVDMQLMPRSYFLHVEEEPWTGAVKRPASDSTSVIPAKKAKAPAGAVNVNPPPGPVAQAHTVERREVPGPVWAGVSLKNNQVMQVTDAVTGLPEYSLRRSSDWFYKRPYGEIFKAILDDGRSNPKAVLVKRVVFRTTSRSREEAAKASEVAAEIFKQEMVAHRRLQHDRIVRLLGWDARLLCLYVEHKPINDLSSPFWRFDNGPDTGYFRGEIGNAYSILANISSALAYLEKNKLLHNDIKPGNILYSKVDLPATGPYSATAAGAVLIDFGLAGPAGTISTGGTPWYIAPEFFHDVRDSGADVFALGVVLLYAMRRIMLPEVWRRYPGWAIGDVRHRTPQAIKAMMAWNDEIVTQREQLKAAGLHARETELRALVYRMLLPWTQRIEISELAEATSEW